MFPVWLGGLLQRAMAEYAEKKNPKERSLQNGEAWQAFLETFKCRSEKGFLFQLSMLLRFSAVDDSRTNSLRQALVPLSAEHRLTGDYLGPKTLRKAATLSPQPAALNHLARRTIMRWCDWVDAAVHLRVHRQWHLAPECFDPDAETRQLAALGNAQRHLAKLDQRAKAAWLLDFAAAVDQFKDSPKWTAVAKGMLAKEHRQWTYADVDTLVIALWPLVKGYNWTYRDLLNVIQPALKRPNEYPCDREQDFAAYCLNVLGLRKAAKGATAKDGRPRGHDIARELVPALASPRPR